MGVGYNKIGLPEQKRSTIYEVAKLAGVSHMTAARSFSDKEKVAKGTKERVLIAARALDYRPNFFARGLKGGKTNTIAILWSLGHSYAPHKSFYDLIKKGQKRGYQINLLEIWSDTDKVLAALEEASVRGVDCVVLQTFGKNSFRQLRKKLLGLKSALIVTDERYFGEIDELVWDRYSAIKEVVDHFAKTGRKRPAFIGDVSSNMTKVEVFLEQSKKHGLGADSESIMDTSSFVTSEGGASFSEFLRDHFARYKNGFDAFLCTCDEHAAILMRFLQDQGIQVPDDIAIVGFNDEPLVEIVRPRLASVTRCKEELANIIDRMVFSRLNDPKLPVQQELLEMRFVWRESAG